MAERESWRVGARLTRPVQSSRSRCLSLRFAPGGTVRRCRRLLRRGSACWRRCLQVVKIRPAPACCLECETLNRPKRREGKQLGDRHQNEPTEFQIAQGAPRREDFEHGRRDQIGGDRPDQEHRPAPEQPTEPGALDGGPLRRSGLVSTWYRLRVSHARFAILGRFHRSTILSGCWTPSMSARWSTLYETRT